MKLIDADEVIKYLDQCLKESDNSTPIVYATLTAIKCYIEDAPTVDVMRCKYSVCGSIETPLARHRYCPNCGAKMRGERKENEDIKNKEAN